MSGRARARSVRLLACVSLVWTFVALVAGAQAFVADRLAGGATSPVEALARHLPLLALWALVTPAVLASARRFPVRGGGGRGSLLAHAALGTLFIVSANVAIRLPGLLSGGPLDGPGDLLRATATGLARWYPLALVVYGMIVAVGHGLAGSDTETREPESDGRTSRLRATRPDAAERADPPMGGRPIPLRSGGALRFVRPTEVEWIEADRNYVLLHDVTGRTHRIRSALQDMEEALASEGFARVHRSALVRVTAIREIRPADRGDFEVVLRSGDRVPLPRTRRRELARLLGVEL